MHGHTTMEPLIYPLLGNASTDPVPSLVRMAPVPAPKIEDATLATLQLILGDEICTKVAQACRITALRMQMTRHTSMARFYYDLGKVFTQPTPADVAA